MRRLCAVLWFALLFATANLFASTKSTILGTVTDASGGTTPGATVKVTSENMIVNRVVTSNAEGDYVVADLDPGRYSVSVELAGFKSFTRSGVELQVDQRLRVDVSLVVGNVRQHVEVTGQPPLVETDSSSVGQLIDRDQVERLPLNGRYFLSLALLVPGSNGGAPGNHQASNELGGVSLAVNGARAGANNYMLDGVDNNLGFNGYFSLSPSVESIQEFKVQTADYSAEFGRSAGAQVNLVTRSGTNSIHGSAYDFVRNNIFDANDFFSNSAGLPLAPYRRNQFGASFGGPVVIPGVYDGRNRTFFFVNYEGTRIRQPSTRVGSVPTAAMRQGDFSASGLPTVYNPFDVVNGVPQPFPNNTIPPGMINSASTFLQRYVPSPNGPGLSGNFTRDASGSDDINQLTARVDQRIGQNGQLMGRISYDRRAVISPSDFGTPAIGGGGFGSGATEADHPTQMAIGYTHAIRPNLLNDFRIGWNRFVWNYISDNHGKNYTAQAGIQGIPADPTVVGFPMMYFQNFDSWGDGEFIPNLTQPDETFQGGDSITWIKGHHAVKAGWETRRNHRYFLTGGALRGEFDFSGIFTRGPENPAGYDYADFLLGYPDGASRVVGTNFTYNQTWFHGFYVQDDIKATKRLTLNLGLRYELWPPSTEQYNRLSNFDFITGAETFADTKYIPAGYPYPAEAAPTNSTIFSDHRDFGPRVGLAYRLTNDNRTTLRMAYGIFYDYDTGNPQVNLGLNPPFQYNVSAPINTAVPTTTYPLAFATTPALSGYQWLSLFDEHWRNSYLQHWQTSLQREVMPGMVVDVTYLGSKSTHMIDFYDPNTPLPGPGIIQSRRPYPDWAGLDFYGSFASGTYNSLQVKVEKRMSHGLSFLTSYTWSKSIDNASDTWADASPNPYNLSTYMKAPSDFDQTQRFIQSWLYDLPVGHGRQYLGTAPRAVDLVLGGWTVAGILTYATGFPFTVTIPLDQANNGAENAQRPNLVGDWHVSNPSINGWFNPAAFALPALYTFGDVGRNTLRGPHYSNLDFSIMKNFRITEGSHLELRAEMFNTANHPSFGFPGSTIDTSSVGKIYGTESVPREIQLALRYVF